MSWHAYGGPDYQALDLARLPLPLSITAQFLRYGVSVGVWMRPQPVIPVFTQPSHGFFAVASAAIGKRAVARDAQLTAPDDTLLTVRLPDDVEDYWTGVPYSYVKSFDNAIDRWSATAVQTPQGYWYAVLVPAKSAIMPDDLDGPAGSYATSAQMIFDKLISGDWRNPGTGDMDPNIPTLLREIQKPEYEMITGWQGDTPYYQIMDRKSPPLEYAGDDFENAVQH